ncbi:MAG: aldose epimerase family protein [Bryobacteraceae bacterium]
MNRFTRKTLRLSLALVALLLVGCSSPQETAAPLGQAPVAWGKTSDGASVELYTLANAKGAEAGIITYGGIVVSLKVPDRSGVLGDVVAGFDNLQGYLTPAPYFGAIIGRYGNRIGGSRFALNGSEYKLTKNDGGNQLHGGPRGFDKRLWQARPLSKQRLELSYFSKDGEEGYPGNLLVNVIYTLTDNNELQIDYAATTDKETVVNLTHHSYFNLSGEGDILSHRLSIHADRITPVNQELIPTGELKSVAGTPFDFRKETSIGERIDQQDQQLTFGRGYDHNWVLNRSGSGLEPAALVTDPKSGRVMQVLTTMPGMQFYSGNFLDGTFQGKGLTYTRRSAFCLETQYFPDSPNKPDFPSTVLRPGSAFRSTTVYQFSTI